MNLNNSKASSFDPYDYYKRLTKCIAKKNHIQVDLKQIPGVSNRNSENKKPMFTKQYLTAKFLAKYNKQKQDGLQQSENLSKPRVTGNQAGNKIMKSFVAPEDEKPRKKKEPACFINLPDSFFKSYSGPDVSIFKVPDVPIKRVKIFENQIPQPPTLAPTMGSNISINTVNSACFKPPKASTPLDKPKPLISDPDEFTDLRNSTIFFLCTPTQNADNDVKKFMEVVDKAARKLDSKGFGKMPDPLIAIRKRIRELHEYASDYPREMSETLMSEHTVVTKNTSTETSRPVYSLPIPQFYDEPGDKPEAIEEILSPQQAPQSSLSETSDLFNWMEKDEIFVNPEVTPGFNTPSFPMSSIVDVDVRTTELAFTTPSPNEFFKFKPLMTDMTSFLLKTPKSTLQTGAKHSDSPKDSIFGFSLTDDYTMDFDFPNLDCLNTQNFDDTFAVFSSPPDLNRRSRVSRSQLEKTFEEALNNHGNSSLSTYKWTPHVKHVPSANESFSSSQPYPFEPRNILKSSFGLF